MMFRIMIYTFKRVWHPFTVVFGFICDALPGWQSYSKGMHVSSSPTAGGEFALANKDLMRAFEKALQEDAEVDLISLIPDSYHEMHQDAQLQNLQTDTAKLNQRTINELQRKLRHNFDIDLLSAFPPTYTRRLRFAQQSTKIQTVPEVVEHRGPPGFRTRLSNVDTATIVSPLSADVTELIQLPKTSTALTKTELSSLQQMLWRSTKLWELPFRGIVVKCSDDLIAKIVKSSGDYTEYTALQYLAEHAPEIPVPRPHGLIRAGPLAIIFMTYIPSITLTEAWPRLSSEQKVSVQNQLDDIFRRLRALPNEGIQCLGGVAGEGVKGSVNNTVIRTAAEFENFRYSTPHHGNHTYITLLRSLLPDPVENLVFSHGDLRQDNIMVRLNQDNTCTVTGIIDWEDGGFYPEYYECTQLTRTMGLKENDWFLHLPESVAPSKYPIHWLVDRLWDMHSRTA